MQIILTVSIYKQCSTKIHTKIPLLKISQKNNFAHTRLEIAIILIPKLNLCNFKIYLGAFVKVQIIVVVRPFFYKCSGRPKSETACLFFKHTIASGRFIVSIWLISIPDLQKKLHCNNFPECNLCENITKSVNRTLKQARDKGHAEHGWKEENADSQQRKYQTQQDHCP